MTPNLEERLFKQEYALELLKIAEGDLESARGLNESKRGRPENICFLAQQCIEKALKAVLCWNQIPFPLVHDAGILVAKMPNGVVPPAGYHLAILTKFATVKRYEEGSLALTAQEIAAVLQIATDVFDWAKKIIGTPGGFPAESDV